jgi:hypothetical protein
VAFARVGVTGLYSVSFAGFLPVLECS